MDKVPYMVIRNLRGGWPNWWADLDDGRKVYIRVRHGYVSVGVGKSEDDAMDLAEVIKSSERFAGVTDVVDALIELRELGYYYACTPV